MKLAKIVSTAIIMAAFLVVLSACDTNEGPVEKAGKKIDQATQSLGDQMEEAGENIQDAAKGD
ncbi:MAG: hypothetical protein QNK15_04005 [Cycloclasticus sp.]|nr:hypothetical protein [Cycloclasticus sp.]